MSDYLNFDTYLIFTPKKFSITVKQRNDFQNIYFEEKNFEKEINISDTNILDNFLNENIFKIEKKINSFINNVNIIIDCEEFVPVQISIKKNNNGKLLNTETVKQLVYEANTYCEKTLENKKIMHIIINNFIIDKKKYQFMPQQLECDYISLDISFICLRDKFFKNIEQVINNYQISVNRIISMKYIKKIFDNENLDFVDMAKNIIEGYNPNEVSVTSKKPKNKGFFEKFFHFFN